MISLFLAMVSALLMVSIVVAISVSSVVVLIATSVKEAAGTLVVTHCLVVASVMPMSR